jgi:hypothetical protein
MRIGVLALLTCSLLAGPRPAPASRIENRTTQAWKVGLGSWVAGTVRIREAGGHTELASLDGAGYLLKPGKSIDLEILPTRNSLALQVTFSAAGESGSSASIFISQGNPGDQPTLNINPAPAVHVNKTLYGRSREGAFVLID